MFELNQLVEIKDKNKVENDKTLESEALKIIEASKFRGEITKIEDGIHFVGFLNDEGWVTQGFKENEIKAVE